MNCLKCSLHCWIQNVSIDLFSTDMQRMRDISWIENVSRKAVEPNINIIFDINIKLYLCNETFIIIKVMCEWVSECWQQNQLWWYFRIYIMNVWWWEIKECRNENWPCAFEKFVKRNRWQRYGFKLKSNENRKRWKQLSSISSNALEEYIEYRGSFFSSLQWKQRLTY